MIVGKWRNGDRIILVMPFGFDPIVGHVCPDCDDPQRHVGGPHTRTRRHVCERCGGWGCLR